MLQNYLKIALRSLIRQRVYSIINIVGLSTGIASCLLITMFVANEFSYDNFHPNADRIYKVALERKYPNHSTYYAIIPHSYADVMIHDFPEVNQVVKMRGPFNGTIVSYQNSRSEEKRFEEDHVMVADSNFFKFFNIKLLKGDREKTLLNVNDIVVTEETAKRYFGSEEPIGKTLRIFDQDFNVTGVCENVPDNSHFRFDLLFKWDDNFLEGQSNFTTFSAHTYLELKPGADPLSIEAKFPKMVDTYASSQIERDLGKSWEDYKKEGNGYRYFLQPLKSIHLDPTNIEAKMAPGGNINYVYFLISVAALILLIACINFMNLATARSAERAREVGLRKTMGSQKGQLVSQFLIESIVLSFLSTLFAICLALIAMPFFNDLADKNLTLNFSVELLARLTAISLIVGFLAGSYPAFALSSFNPVAVMKGSFSASKSGAWLRNGLVIFQFVISIILIVGTMVIGEQMKFMQNKSLGYNKDRILVVERLGDLDNKVQTFLDEMRSMPNVENAAGAFSLFGRQGDFFGSQFLPEGSSEILTTKTMTIDDEFAQTVDFKFVEGKGYSKETNDSLSIILNESAVKTLELTDPIGKKLSRIQRRQDGNVTISYTVIGVIKDFNFQSLRDQVTPLAIQSVESFAGGGQYAYVRIEGNELSSTVAMIESKWKELAPEQPFKYLFLDQNLNAQYDAEQRAGNIFGVFSGLAIIIACVGLFGLAAYTASLRTKEIGVRKVLGASVASIVFLLSKDQLKLILIAFLVAIPFSWYIMDNWLSGFAYHIEMNAGVLIIAGSSAILVSWITVSYQSIKAAIVNPIKSLKSE